MGAEAEANRQTVTAGGVGVMNGKVSDGVEKKTSMGSDAPTKPVGASKGPAVLNGLLKDDDDIATTLAAASEKLQAAHRMEQKKRKSGLSRCLGALFPKKFFIRLRDYYINTCMMAAEKGDFVDLVAGHPGMYYGDTIMSRNISQRRDREHEEILQASLSRQVSISLSRQQSQQSQSGPLQMTRNTSTGMSGLSRNASSGISGLTRNASSGMSGLNRQASTTGRNTFGRNSSTRKNLDSNLFSAGRNTFLQKQSSSVSLSNGGQLNPTALNQNSNVATFPIAENCPPRQQ